MVEQRKGVLAAGAEHVADIGDRYLAMPLDVSPYTINHLSVGPDVGQIIGSVARTAHHVDYNELPASAPESWPGIRRNEVGVSRFVYGFMVDTLRRVSQHVTIGSAARNGKPMGSWFVLCREP